MKHIIDCRYIDGTYGYVGPILNVAMSHPYVVLVTDQYGRCQKMHFCTLERAEAAAEWLKRGYESVEIFKRHDGKWESVSQNWLRRTKMGKTKKEEYDALNQIRGILKDFDPEDTYIGKAFEGCVEQAEENLHSDFMMSYKDRYDNVSEQLHAANARIKDVTKKLRDSEERRVDLAKQLNQKDDAIARLEDAKKEYEKEIESALLAKRDYKAQIGQLQNDYKALQISHEELKQARSRRVAQELVDLRQTILELKAKLYDMMAGEEVEE